MNKKILALVEVIAVFALTLSLIAIVSTSSTASRVRELTYRSFLEYIVMIAVPLLVLLAFRRNLASYGLSFQKMRYQLDIALTGFIPVALAGLANSFVDDTSASGAFVLAATWIAVLVVLGLLLRRKPTLGGTTVMAAVPLIWFSSSPAAQVDLWKAISALVFYVFFLGFGEELLFRGYIQSRLNTAFGKPFSFFGVAWGWGAVIASLLFGIMHFLNLGGLTIMGHWSLTPWWGVWTFFGGLAFSFIREKTGSIVAPSILHGLPQGIAWAVMGL
jgi:membrane protease YdiL (CAAX protease family)